MRGFCELPEGLVTGNSLSHGIQALGICARMIIIAQFIIVRAESN